MNTNTTMTLTDFTSDDTAKLDSKPTIRKIVEGYIQFFKKQDRNPADLIPILSEKFKFSGPLGVFTSRDYFLADVKRDALSIVDIKLHHVLVEGQHASALYEVISSDPQVKKLLFSEWFTIENSKIATVFSIYDAAEIKEIFSQI